MAALQKSVHLLDASLEDVMTLPLKVPGRAQTVYDFLVQSRPFFTLEDLSRVSDTSLRTWRSWEEEGRVVMPIRDLWASHGDAAALKGEIQDLSSRLQDVLAGQQDFDEQVANAVNFHKEDFAHQLSEARDGFREQLDAALASAQSKSVDDRALLDQKINERLEAAQRDYENSLSAVRSKAASDLSELEARLVRECDERLADVRKDYEGRLISVQQQEACDRASLEASHSQSLDAAQADFEDRLAALQQQALSDQADLEARHAHELAVKEADWRIQNAEMEQTLRCSHETAIAALRDDSSQRVSALQSELADLHSGFDEERSRLQREIDRLRDIAADAETEDARLQALRHEITELENRSSLLLSEKEDMARMLAAERHASSDLRDRLNEATRLQAEGTVELRLVRGQLDRVTARCATLEKEVERRCRTPGPVSSQPDFMSEQLSAAYPADGVYGHGQSSKPPSAKIADSPRSTVVKNTRPSLATGDVREQAFMSGCFSPSLDNKAPMDGFRGEGVHQVDGNQMRSPPSYMDVRAPAQDMRYYAAPSGPSEGVWRHNGSDHRRGTAQPYIPDPINWQPVLRDSPSMSLSGLIDGGRAQEDVFPARQDGGRHPLSQDDIRTVADHYFRGESSERGFASRGRSPEKKQYRTPPRSQNSKGVPVSPDRKQRSDRRKEVSPARSRRSRSYQESPHKRHHSRHFRSLSTSSSGSSRSSSSDS